ncbi:hypothetical protein HD553DRAFT_347238 [Filobasidium floriforme]|uniref:uncharacterized protein n=1 Tax=Filobasidium floriforme TaxID=5210 RepID=UPI001E8DB333|nr:uncharacterized protein HD553DRAFT_347238 [Filobasidium floriforme]KAH8090771.1 hypothetical protein HD553DRAFT_347238 [Filobasidium floriforme]
MSTGLPPMSILEPLIKSRLEQDPWMNLGGFVLGYAIDSIFFGMMCVTLVNWLRYGAKESLTIKLVLAYSIIAGVVATGFNMYIMIYHFMYHFGDYAPFFLAAKTGGWAFIGSLSVPQIQAFYGMRAFRLNDNNYILLVVIVLGILCQFSASMACAVMTYSVKAGELGKRKDAVKVPIYIWVSSTLYADGLITAAIIYGLMRNKTGFVETERLINRLITVALEASLPATLVSIAFLTTFCITENTTLFILFWEMFHPKVYILPFIAVLNSRVKFQRDFAGLAGGHSSTFIFNDKEGTRIRANTVSTVQDYSPGPDNASQRPLDDRSTVGGESTTHLTTPPFAVCRT